MTEKKKLNSYVKKYNNLNVSLSLSLKKTKQSGFTLIELMVVMAIIAILATAGLSAYTGYIRKARDFVRIENLRQIKNALELYHMDKGHYPIVNAGWWYSNTSSWQTLGAELNPYLPTPPADPINNSGVPWVTGGFSYAYGYTDAAGSVYNLVAQLEDANNNLRCELTNYKFFVGTEYAGSWCDDISFSYSKYMYAAGPQSF